MAFGIAFSCFILVTRLTLITSEWRFGINNSTVGEFSDNVAQILTPFYCEKSSIVDVICDEEVSDIVTSVIRSFKSCTSMQILTNRDPRFSYARKKTFNLFVLENFSNFMQIMDKISNFEINFNGFFSLIFIDIDYLEIKQVFEKAWAHSMYNVNVLTGDKFNNVSMFTFEPFRNDKCRETNPVLQQIKPLMDIFPNKLNNFHKCPIRIPETNFFPGIQFNVSSNETLITGMEGEILLAASDALNLTVEVLLDTKNELWGESFGYN